MNIMERKDLKFPSNIYLILLNLYSLKKANDAKAQEMSPRKGALI